VQINNTTYLQADKGGDACFQNLLELLLALLM
jgi:hypothetical protein